MKWDFRFILFIYSYIATCEEILNFIPSIIILGGLNNTIGWCHFDVITQLLVSQTLSKSAIRFNNYIMLSL